MSEMSRTDAELVYRYASGRFLDDVESDAYTETLEAWQTERPDDYEALEAAYEDPDSTFDWADIDFETDPAYDGDLVPISGVMGDEEAIRELANDFAWDYLDAIRDRIRSEQDRTIYAPREFVALVLDAAENTPEDLAHREMDISLGNYRGKKGTVKEKLQTAENTVRITERIRA